MNDHQYRLGFSRYSWKYYKFDVDKKVEMRVESPPREDEGQDE